MLFCLSWTNLLEAPTRNALWTDEAQIVEIFWKCLFYILYVCRVQKTSCVCRTQWDVIIFARVVVENTKAGIIEELFIRRILISRWIASLQNDSNCYLLLLLFKNGFSFIQLMILTGIYKMLKKTIISPQICN